MNDFENYDGYNCGGYAFNIPVCIYGDGINQIRDNALDQCVWGLLKKFDFIRLIEEKDPIQEDEYKVHYRVGMGHHFVKDDNGVLTDKWENKAPGIFNGWGEDLKDKPEAVFAVKRNHDQNYRYSIFITDLVPENFERKVKKEICCNNKNFVFDNRKYEIIRPCDNDSSFYEIRNQNKEKIAEAIYVPKQNIFDNRENFAIEIESGKKNEVISKREKEFTLWKKIKDEIMTGRHNDEKINENIKERGESNFLYSSQELIYI